MLSQCLGYGQGHALFNLSTIIASKFDESLHWIVFLLQLQNFPLEFG